MEDDLSKEEPFEYIFQCDRCHGEIPRFRKPSFGRKNYCDTCSYHINMQILKWHKDGRVVPSKDFAARLEISLDMLYQRITRLGISTKGKLISGQP